MIRRIIGLVVMALIGVSLSPMARAADPDDTAGSKDPALFSRMPGFYIYNYEEKDFDRYTFPTGYDKTQAVEGRHVYVDYYAHDGIKLPSALQIARNYGNAIKAIGGEVVYQFEDGGTEYVTLRAVRDRAEVWAHLQAAGNGMYKIHVIEKQAMDQAVTASADSLAGSIRATGRAAVYGIYFDVDQAVIKPESEAAIAEIAKLLRADAGLKLYVVGHTDNTGGFDHNVQLSRARAAAVVNALVKGHGIAAARLMPFGAGPTAPVAANATEEGRAKNRRVELVAQ